MTIAKSILACACSIAAAGTLASVAQADAVNNTQIGQPGDPASASRTVEIVLQDNYFEPESISVSQGETIRFVIANQGVALHEFNIGTPAMHVEHQAEMMVMVQHGMIAVDRINHDMMGMDGGSMDHDDPNSVLLEPGQSTELTWTFSGSGDLEFACNIPGHYQVGMVGQVNIQH